MVFTKREKQKECAVCVCLHVFLRVRKREEGSEKECVQMRTSLASIHTVLLSVFVFALVSKLEADCFSGEHFCGILHFQEVRVH